MKFKASKSERAVMGGLLVLIAILSVIFFTSDKKQPAAAVAETQFKPGALAPADLEAQRVSWSERFKQEDPQQAYKEFKDESANRNIGSQHMLAHIVGAIIYDRAGTDGVNICDDSFSFGCFHGFFSNALSQKGPDIIKDLDKACIAKFGPLGSGCQHGIGHGVMDYYGPKHIDQALNACKQTTIPSELAGCPSGVFMEYNVPITIREGQVDSKPRTFDSGHPYSPCSEVEARFTAPCYYSLPQWWQNSIPADYKTMGQMCLDSPDKKQVETCLLGMGNIAPTASNYDPEKTIALCQTLPTQYATVICQAGSAWSFDATPKYRPLASQLCGQLAGPDLETCRKKAHYMNPENNDK